MKKITIVDMQVMKDRGEKIAMLTAYDYPTSRILDGCGVEVLLVGDSVGSVMAGYENTLPVTVDEIIYHCRAVAKGRTNALLVADMPFMSYTSVEQALANATDLIQLGGAQMVKLEASSRQVNIVQELSECGIPICAHLGLRPQFIHKLGGYAMQGNDEASAKELLESAQSLQAAGADMLLLECVQDSLAQKITQNSSIPVIGIGSGANCDGQILVLHDVIGITHGVTPKFAKNFLAGAIDIQSATDTAALCREDID